MPAMPEAAQIAGRDGAERLKQGFGNEAAAVKSSGRTNMAAFAAPPRHLRIFRGAQARVRLFDR
jgi:hypothetical protein